MPRAEVVHVLLQFADGTIGAMQFVAALYNQRTGEPISTHEPTPDAIQAEIEKLQSVSVDEDGVEHTGLPKEKIPVQSWRFCSPDEYPKDRTYRDAWRDRGGRIEHDMAHAREIHRMHLRRDRGPVLEQLDVAMQRATEPNADGSAKSNDRNDPNSPVGIAQRKQKLRDVTRHPAIEAAETVDQLKTLTLEALTR